MNILNGIAMNWDLGSFFSNLTAKGKEWGGYFIVFLGVILIIIGVFNIVKAFMSQGRGQTNWFMTIAMILVGGFLCAAGVGSAAFDKMTGLANIGAGTISELGQ